MNVRRATEADMPSIVSMGVMMVHEAPAYAGLPLSDGPDKVARLSMDHGAIIVAVNDAGLPCGMAAAILTPHPIVDRWEVSDTALYVLPTYRGGTAAARLVRALVAWAFNETDAYKVTLGVSTGVHPERTGRLYERMGFKPVAVAYELRLRD